MNNLRTLLIALPCIILSPLAAAHADALDLTVDVGTAKQKGDRFSESDSSIGLSLGYELTSNWSLNLSYTDFGKAQMQSATLVSPDNSYQVFRYIKTKGLGLTAQYLTDPLLGDWAFGARFGVMHVDTKMIDLVPDFSGDLDNTTLDSGSAPTVGLLASYRLTGQMNLIVSADFMAPEVQTYTNASEDIKTTRFAVGLNYHF